MKRFAVIVLLSFLFVACRSEEQVSYPDDILPRETFVEVMAEMYLIESIYNHKISTDDMTAEDMEGYYADVFARYHITFEDYNQALEWHKAHPEQMYEVYDEVLLKLEEKRDDM